VRPDREEGASVIKKACIARREPEKEGNCVLFELGTMLLVKVVGPKNERRAKKGQKNSPFRGSSFREEKSCRSTFRSEPAEKLVGGALRGMTAIQTDGQKRWR